jgi:hypothetical protein
MDSVTPVLRPRFKFCFQRGKSAILINDCCEVKSPDNCVMDIETMEVKL